MIMDDKDITIAASDHANLHVHGKELKEKHERLSKLLSDVLQTSKGLNPVVHKAVNNPLVLKAIKKLKKAKGDESLSSHDLKTLNKRFMSGHLPRSKPTHDSTDYDTDEDDDDDENDAPVYVTKKSTVFTKLLAYQLQLFWAAKHYVLKYSSKYGNSWLRSVIPTNQIFTLISFLLYTYILNAEFLMYFLPLLIFTISFIVMIVSTLQSLRGEKRFKEFVAWSELLVTVDTALNVEEARDNYFRNHLSPLISFPPAFILNVFSFFMVSTEILPDSELALLSVILSSACFYSYFSSFNKVSFYTFGFHFSASILEGFQRLSDDYGLRSRWFVVVGSLGEFELHLSLPVVLRFIVLALLVAVLFQSRYKYLHVGFFRGLVPMLYVLLWWEMFCLFFLGSSVSGLLRAGIGTIILLTSIPATIIFFFFAAFKWFTLKVAVMIVLVVISLVYFRLLDNVRNWASRLLPFIRNFGPALKIISVLFCVIGLAAMVAFYQPSGLKIRNSTLTWLDYHKICFADDNDSPVVAKRLCYQLNDHLIEWTGVVEDIHIASIENKFESLLQYLPSSLANWLSCVYGKRYRNDEAFCSESKFNARLCLLAEKSQRECYLDKYNKYEFVIVIKHTDTNLSLLTTQMKVMADNRFKKLVFLLRRGMSVKYNGLLHASSGVVQAQKLTALDNVMKQIPQRDMNMSFRLAVYESAKGLLRFFFSPFIAFTEPEEN